MNPRIELLQEQFGRLPDLVSAAVQGLSPQQLAYRPAEAANSIAWLVWHLTRIQDDHLADLAGSEQVWTGKDWERAFDLPFASAETGFGASPKDVAALDGTTEENLLGYFADTHRRTAEIIGGFSDADLDRIVDDSFDPPVTAVVRLSSVLGDDLQHLGQAAYVRGLQGA